MPSSARCRRPPTAHPAQHTPRSVSTHNAREPPPTSDSPAPLNNLGELATLLIPPRRERTCPRAVKRARHNSYRVKKPGEPASIRHRAPATITIRRLKPRSAA
jgi:hypothetical protein